MPFALVAMVLVLDLVAGLRPWPVPVVGLLDEPAHLATAWLALAALAPVDLPRRLWLPALVAAVAIDVDHVPLYLTGGRFAVDGGRPPTHCLLTVAALALVGLLAPGTRWALGAAAGVLLHLLRDVATGPGVSLLWPLDPARVLVPWPWYVGLLLLLATAATARSTGAPPDRLG